jgi:hypothetical protein
MCEQCTKIDQKIERYGYLASRVTDQTLIDGVNGLIGPLRALQVALHPNQVAPIGQ